ncbi:hypothetical protein [Polluticaenibacter yanchengensis]|uniref:DUF1330 domain-containing protein n=1 Tax=Polluticaenibacter yanchengensis TaxID=3014562 RepID=A0ABT4UP40_9BACT|nr:hypothetical protein [Chitinophagaceae bacterium LY-5]
MYIDAIKNGNICLLYREKEKVWKQYHKALSYLLPTTEELTSSMKKNKSYNMLIFQENASYDSIVSFNNSWEK